MKLIHSNLLNSFWKKGIVPIKADLEKKIAASKIVNNLLTTKEGYVLDARQGKVLQDQVAEINSNFDAVSIINQLVYDPSNVIINYAEKIGRILLLTGTVLGNIDISIKLPPGMHIRTILGIPCQNYSAWGNGDFQCFLAPINVSGNEIIVHTAGSPHTYTIFYVVAFITSV